MIPNRLTLELGLKSLKISNYFPQSNTLSREFRKQITLLEELALKETEIHIAVPISDIMCSYKFYQKGSS